MKRHKLPRGFFFNLAILLKAGISLNHALKILEETEQQPIKKEMIGKIRNYVDAGGLLSESIRKTAPVSDFVLYLIAFGEQSGKLLNNLELGARYLQEMQKAKQKTISAIIYPGFILLFSIIGVLLLVKFFLPNFIPIFNDLRGELPIPTRLLVGLYSLLSLLHLAFGLLSILVLYIAIRKSNHRFDRFLLSIPMLGGFLKLLFASQLSRTLAASQAAGISYERALGFFAQSLSNDIFRSTVLDLRLALIRGESLSNVLSSEGILPSYFGPMMAAAENSGKMLDLLSRCTVMIEEEIQDQLERLTAALEPAVLTGLGLFVGFVLTGIFSPLYKMVEAIA